MSDRAYFIYIGLGIYFRVPRKAYNLLTSKTPMRGMVEIYRGKV